LLFIIVIILFLQDEPAVQEENVLTVLGHRLVRKESRSSKYYCEKCNSLIWGVVQEWRKCLGWSGGLSNFLVYLFIYLFI
jgi:hypothetical protein